MSSYSSQPIFSTLRFVQSTGQPSGDKKRIASKACDACRRRKKRCFHAVENRGGTAERDLGGGAEGHGSIERPTDRQPDDCQRRTGLDDAPREARPGDGNAERSQPSEPSNNTFTPLSTGGSVSATHSRFIGDLNPAVELLSATTPTRQPKNNVGVWHTEAAEQSNSESTPGTFTPMSLFHGCSESVQKQLQTIVKTESLDVRPCWQNFEIMEAFYFENVHPILPYVDKAVYWDSPAGSPTKTLLQQIICLVTCPNTSLKTLLRLPGHDGLLPPADFARQIVNAMRISIEVALVHEKSAVIQALTAMSLVAYGRESLELTPQFFIRAVQHGYTIGLHQPGDAHRNEKTAGLFCSVWSMDRLHAAIQGRPVIMHEVDMAKSPKAESANQQPGFQVLVAIAILLDKVIALYRPEARSVEIPDEEFPTFEEILEECGAIGRPAHLVATLELFYHAVAILSCRYSSGPAREIHKARNNRQASSASQILSIMEDENVAEKIVALPWVPYGISLSLSTAYHDLRHCKALTHRIGAKKRLAQAYKQLLPFGQVFWSAAFIAEMAGKILQERQPAEDENAMNMSRRPSGPQGEAQPVTANAQVEGTGSFDVDQSFFDISSDWNLDDLDDILEGNLDPSISWYHQDLQNFFHVDSLQ